MFDDWVKEYRVPLRVNFYSEFIGKFEVKDIIFNGPATIINWVDGTKTVVKCQDGDTFDKEKGIALCFMKKALDNKSSFNNVFNKYITSNKFKVGDKAKCIDEEEMCGAMISKGDIVRIESLTNTGMVSTVTYGGHIWYVNEEGLQKV